MTDLGNLVSDAIIIFYSIVIEALPYIALGATISGIVSIFIHEKTLIKLLPKGKLASHISIAMLGCFFPVCECGNMPVATRLIRKGISPSLAITFLLAAPVVNPIVILTTYSAFRQTPEMVLLRVGLSFSIAIFVGILLSFYDNQKQLLNTKFRALCNQHDEPPQTIPQKLSAFCSIFVSEVVNMTHAILLGSFIASIVSLIPRANIADISTNVFTATIAMIVLAFVMCICSTVDAFVALSFTTSFPLYSILAFLLFGPMIDIRTVSMMRTVFHWKTIFLIIVSVFQLVLITSFATSFFKLL